MADTAVSGQLDDDVMSDYERIATHGLMVALARYHDVVIEGGSTWTTHNLLVCDAVRKKFYETAVKTVRTHVWPGR